MSTSIYNILIQTKKCNIFFLALICQNSMIPVINKPCKIIRKPATTIDDILINPFVHQTYKSDILKCDIPNQFPIFFP